MTIRQAKYTQYTCQGNFSQINIGGQKMKAAEATEAGTSRESLYQRLEDISSPVPLTKTIVCQSLPGKKLAGLSAIKNLSCKELIYRLVYCTLCQAICTPFLFFIH